MKEKTLGMSPAIQEYFTKNVQESIEKMSNKRMNEILTELEKTEFFVAILRYSRERAAIAQNSLLNFDPVKEPTSISRYQGFIGGLFDIIDGVISLSMEQAKEEKPKEE
jgi:hypothetical protein